MISDNAPILDWHINASMPEAMQVLAESPIPECITPADPRPIWEQLDQHYPTWEVWGPMNGGDVWALLDNDNLYHPNIGTQIPAAMAWHGSEKILIYKFQLICIVQADDSFTVGRLK